MDEQQTAWTRFQEKFARRFPDHPWVAAWRESGEVDAAGTNPYLGALRLIKSIPGEGAQRLAEIIERECGPWEGA